MTDTEVEPDPLTTYTRAPSGLTATAAGPAPTVIVRITVFVAVRMTLTVLSISLVTYTSAPSGVTATPSGPTHEQPTPADTVATITFVSVSTTDSVWVPSVPPCDGDSRRPTTEACPTGRLPVRR